METIKVKKPKRFVLAEHFLKILSDGMGKNDLYAIYYHIFSVAGFEQLEDTLEYYKTVWQGKDEYFKKDGKECWFYLFHKSVRQTDYFRDTYKRINMKLLTRLEEKEYWFLYDKVHKEGYVKKSENEKELFNDEYKRFLDLSERKRAEKRDSSIGGHLDMILWNAVHLDKDEILSNTFIKVFKGLELD